MNLRDFFPILSWLPKYGTAEFKGDLSAGLTVGVMLVPQGMAYAMLAGLPPIYGLYAAILPLIIYAIFGTSRQLAVGPVAMVSLLIAAGVGKMAETGSDDFIQLAILLALMVGVIQLLMGLFRLGFLVNFLSHPVVSGFTSAAALIIAFSQLKHLLGINIPRSSQIFDTISNSFQNIEQTNIYTLGIGLAAILLILISKKLKSRIPGSLLVVVVGILAVWGTGVYTEGVKIVGSVPEGLPSFAIPIFSWEKIQSLLPMAFTIAFIAFMESIAVAKAILRRHKNYQIVPNQELIALGLANIGGALLQAFPTAGGFGRSAVNDQSGAKTGMAAIISASLIILTLLFLTPLFYYLPQSVLAAIIMVAVFGLIDYKEAIHLWKSYKPDFWMLLVTFVGTLTLGIEEGVLIGVVLSLAMIVFQTTMPHIATLGKIPEKPHYKNLERFDNLENRKDILIARFDARLYYANATYFQEEMQQRILEKGSDLKLFILDAAAMNGLDSSGTHALEEIIDFCKGRNVQFYISGIKGPLRDILSRSNFYEKLGEDKFFLRVQHAVNTFDNEPVASNYKNYALQTNEKK
ncbi:MAG: SulP family sulfate permease [Polaribacter sp.]|jgi:SulP family sulfate permease